MTGLTEETVVYTSTTPSGIEIAYSPAPKRYYKVNGVEVPSVTACLSVLDKSGALTWWGMKVGIEGFQTLLRDSQVVAQAASWAQAPVQDVVDALTHLKLTVNHQKDKAADRGTNIHAAFERWNDDQSFRPDPFYYPSTERGYIEGLNAFLDDISKGDVTDVHAEVMVGSAKHGFAGRYDVRFRLQQECEVVTRIYPKRDAKRELVTPGKYLGDLKSSKAVYPQSHFPQLEAYEGGSIECGYEATDHRVVIHVTEDGRYELVKSTATYEDFLTIKKAYEVHKRLGSRNG